MKRRRDFKKGAASFYIIAFSTLILMIVAASFAAVIISEITRTSNDDLSQSAYDSALAGVEDAKLAYYSYENCKGTPPSDKQNIDEETNTCAKIMYYMKKKPGCDMVGKILGRNMGAENDVVAVEETNVVNNERRSNNMQQSYTCVTIDDTLDGYVGTLSPSQTIKVMKAKFDDDNVTELENKIANKISSVKISWYADSDVSNDIEDEDYTNINSSGVVRFPSLTAKKAATPPTISLAMVQTGREFGIESFDKTKGEQTNRGMIYLVPTFNKDTAEKDSENNAKGTIDNTIGPEGMLKSNDKTKQNLPYKVHCDDPKTTSSEYACTATIKLPRPIEGDGVRNSENFMFVVGMPYGKTAKSNSTSFLLEFFCDENVECRGETKDEDQETNHANLKGVQVEIDSTGKANDLFRRVETRLENTDSMSMSIMGPLELLKGGSDGNGSGNNGGLEKDYAVTCEYNFDPITCN